MGLLKKLRKVVKKVVKPVIRVASVAGLTAIPGLSALAAPSWAQSAIGVAKGLRESTAGRVAGAIRSEIVAARPPRPVITATAGHIEAGIGGSMGIPQLIGGILGGRVGAAATGATIAGAASGLFGGKKRVRRRRRLTSRELQELMVLKQVLGPRSPVVTIAGMKMLERGG